MTKVSPPVIHESASAHPDGGAPALLCCCCHQRRFVAEQQSKLGQELALPLLQDL